MSDSKRGAEPKLLSSLLTTLSDNKELEERGELIQPLVQFRAAFEVKSGLGMAAKVSRATNAFPDMSTFDNDTLLEWVEEFKEIAKGSGVMTGRPNSKGIVDSTDISDDAQKKLKSLIKKMIFYICDAVVTDQVGLHPELLAKLPVGFKVTPEQVFSFVSGVLGNMISATILENLMSDQMAEMLELKPGAIGPITALSHHYNQLAGGGADITSEAVHEWESRKKDHVDLGDSASAREENEPKKRVIDALAELKYAVEKSSGPLKTAGQNVLAEGLALAQSLIDNPKTTDQDYTLLSSSLKHCADVIKKPNIENGISNLAHDAEQVQGRPSAWKKFLGGLLVCSGVALIVVSCLVSVPTFGGSLLGVPLGNALIGAGAILGGAALGYSGTRRTGYSKAIVDLKEKVKVEQVQQESKRFKR